MAHKVLLCLLVLTSSFQHVTSFSVHRRHSRNSGLADALRMLERQRRRIDMEEKLAASSQQRAEEESAERAEVESFLTSSDIDSAQNELSPAWMSKTLGARSSRLVEPSPGDLEIGEFLDEPVQPSSSEMIPPGPSYREGDDDGDDELRSPPRLNKKDKEVMTNVVGDARPRVQTRSSNDDVNTEASDDVSVSRGEFQALVRAVETIQQEAMEKAEEEEEEADEVMEEVQEKIAEAREEAKEEEEAEEEAEAAMEETSDPLMVGSDELGDLFEERSEEVIPTEHGEVIKVERTVKNSAGQPVGEEEAVEEVQAFPGDDTDSALASSSSSSSSSAPSVQDLWFVKTYLDEERRRRKRTSKRGYIPTALMAESPARQLMASELVQAYAERINELETDLDQAEMQTYLEDVENDLLTQALDQATLTQLHPGTLPLRELHALRDAIRVEEMLQEVKADRTLASDLAEELDSQVSADMGEEVEEKRGEPWRKRSDAMPAEVPVYVMGEGSDAVEGTTALALKDQLDEDDDDNTEDPFVPFSDEDVDLEGYADEDGGGDDGDLTGESAGSSGIASLFSEDADQCPAVQAFSTNCRFAGHTIDFEARALCNLHEMCYACGESLGMKQNQCDFVYQAASTMLCENDRQCVKDSQLFLNAMKLKHRFVPYAQPLCRARCTARFLSII
ncbi:uncharacterized protein LOC143289223 [Babylonia areolata]|uniref:uncharacterized protein LOC143289223 n=1 Tax=Babylonia areolata TaxID=304850 RepID=UPI003FD62475